LLENNTRPFLPTRATTQNKRQKIFTAYFVCSKKGKGRHNAKQEAKSDIPQEPFNIIKIFNIIFLIILKGWHGYCSPMPAL
jgi:hypothetical protein